jgi:hypothetical protein
MGALGVGLLIGAIFSGVHKASALKSEPALVIMPISGAGPYRQPQLAAGNGQVGLAFGSEHAIYFAASRDAGHTFAAPVKVADVDALALGRHRGPRVTYWKSSILISAVAGEQVAAGPHAHGLPADGNLTVWRSEDSGRTWTKGAIVNDVPSAAREGLHAITADTKGNLFAVWLDLRTEGTQLYSSRSTDGGRTWEKNLRVYASPDGTICQCCDPSLVADGKGEIAIMWRNAVDGARDMYFSVTESTAGARGELKFGPAQKLGTGTWKINACPMDGGGLAIFQNQVYSVWRREGDVYLAQPGKAEEKIGTGKDVAVTASKLGVFAGWNHGEAIEVLAPGASSPLQIAEKGSFLNLAALPDGGVIAAWEANGSIVTRRLQ